MKRYYITYSVLLTSLCAVFSYSVIRAFYYLITGIELDNAMPFQANLPQWILPYAAIGMALILVVLIQPFIKRLSTVIVHIATFILGIGAFFGFELLFETIPALSEDKMEDIFFQQSLLCYRPVENFYPKGVPKLFDPVVKVHFYVLSIILILIFSKIIVDFLGAVYKKQKLTAPFYMRLSTGAVLLAICVIGNLTDFFRNGNRDLPPLSVFLTVMFFLSQSVSVGMFTNSFIKSPKRQKIISPVAAVITCVIVYIGEFFVLGGVFYSLGKGWFFEGFTRDEFGVNTMISPADILVVLLSGAAALGLTLLIQKISKRK